MEARKLRGAAIAEAGGLQKMGDHLWVVPSQSHAGKWVVDHSGDEPTCTCPDYEKRSAFCKHIFAIEIHERRLTMPTDTPTERKTYTQDWPAYNAAQVNERDHFLQLLHGICQGITMPEQTGRGRPKTPLADVVFAMAIKVYEGKSGRRASSVIRDCAKDGLIDKPVSYNTISDYMRKSELTPLLRVLVQESAAPLAGLETTVAVDSSGFGTSTYDRWFDQKWGKSKKRRKFVKAHAACGTRTNVCTDLVVNDRGDATQMETLLDGTAKHFRMEEVSADKAYSSKANLAATMAHGAVPYIPFKEGTTAKNGPAIWRKMFHYFQYKREDFDAAYHRRSNVETLFGVVKGKFGSSVRAKDEAAQVNEVYLKFIAHNIVVLVSAIYEFGLIPEFWQEAS
jgi:transposase